MPIEYKSAEQLCNAAKTEYEYELTRNSSLDNKVSITLAFCGVVILFLVNYLDIRTLWTVGTPMYCWECILRFICTLLQIGCMVCFGICMVKLFAILIPRTYFRLDTDFLLDEGLQEWETEQAYMVLGCKYAEFTCANRTVNEERSKKYGRSIKWLLVAVLLYFLNEIIHLNFL